MNGRVLVVEDSPTQAAAALSVLQAAEFDVTVASSGERALEILEQDRFDIVVSDVVMPGITGYELCRAVKTRLAPREIPVVLLTSLTDPMAIIRGLECGADNYVTKPYSPGHLITRIRHTLDKYSLRTERRASMGVNVSFLGSTFVITSEREQILDLFLSSIEDVVRTNEELLASQQQLAEAEQQLRAFASRMEQEAVVSAEKYAILMQSAADAILVVDGDGRIEEANRRAAELLGESPERLRGRALADFVHPNARPLLESQLSRTGGLTARAADIEFTHRENGRIFFDMTVSRTAAGGAGSALVILHDVTSRRDTEERIRRSEAQLATAQRVAGLGSFEWDLVADCVVWSEQTAHIFGRDTSFTPTFQGVAGQVHEEDRASFRRDVEQAIEGTGGNESELRLVRPDGTIRHVRMRREVHRNANGAANRMIGTILDITDRRNLEEQLRQSQKMEAIGQLAGGIAHDFNNLITVITSYSDMTMAALGEDSPLRDDIAEIRRAGESAAALTRQLLAFSRKEVIKAKPLSLSATVRGLNRILDRLIGDDITLVVDLDPDDGMVMADAGQIEQLVLNLAVNGRDAMPKGGRLTIRTSQLHVPPGGSVLHPELVPGSYEVLTVADVGIGMDKATRERIFEPFFTTKPQGQGTGLGLSTVYGITKQSGGEISVTSSPGRGTTFSIFLPSIASEAGRTEAHGAAAHCASQRKNGRAATTLLIVEDEAPVRILLTRLLRKEGYKVLEAASGPAAVSLAEEFKDAIDLVITDVVMPEMSGPVMVDRISEARKGVKAIFISGYTHDDILRRGLSDPNVTFMQKPFGPKQLVETVRNVLG